jgi:hypothetical protein
MAFRPGSVREKFPPRMPLNCGDPRDPPLWPQSAAELARNHDTAAPEGSRECGQLGSRRGRSGLPCTPPSRRTGGPLTDGWRGGRSSGSMPWGLIMCGSVRPAAGGFSDRDRLGDLGSQLPVIVRIRWRSTDGFLPSGFSGACRVWPGGAGPACWFGARTRSVMAARVTAIRAAPAANRAMCQPGIPPALTRRMRMMGCSQIGGSIQLAGGRLSAVAGELASSGARVSPPTAQANWGSIHEDLRRVR